MLNNPLYGPIYLSSPVNLLNTNYTNKQSMKMIEHDQSLRCFLLLSIIGIN